MAEVYKKTLIHEWNFLGEERTEDERLTDTVGGVKAKLGYNASLQPEGIYLSYGDANYMKAYALMDTISLVQPIAFSFFTSSTSPFETMISTLLSIRS